MYRVSGVFCTRFLGIISSFCLFRNLLKVVLEVSQFFLLLALECSHALEHLVPVNEGAVELWAIDTNELCLASDCQTASAAHACSVNHNGIERNLARDVMFLSGEVREFHHYWRSNSKHLVDMLLFDEFLDTNGNDAFFTIRTVISHYDDLVA